MMPTPRTIYPSLEDGYVLLVEDGLSVSEPFSPRDQESIESYESSESGEEMSIEKPLKLECLNRFSAIPLILCCFLLAGLVLNHVTTAAVPSHKKLVIMNRTAYVYKPKVGPVTAAVLVLHGSQGQASDMFDLGFERLADLHGFYVVYPEMAVPKSSMWGYQHDLPYFSMLATRLREPSFGVMAGKLFVCGHSAGGSMTTFLQNEMDDFAAAGVVEAALGGLPLWNMTRRGHRTVLIWNHGDPVLKQYAPKHEEMALYNLTVQTLRRSAAPTPDHNQPLQTGKTVVMAERLTFNKTNAAPELRVISWESRPGRHDWARPNWTQALDATAELIDFFFEHNQTQDLIQV